MLELDLNKSGTITGNLKYGKDKFKQFPGLYDIMSEIKQLSVDKGFYLDLHSGNLMFRGDTPVITDPFSND